MNIQQTISDLSALSVDERLHIVQELWNSIPAEAELAVTPDQRKELERRVAAHDADPGSAITRDELERLVKGDA